jgi:hypothetical protein
VGLKPVIDKVDVRIPAATQFSRNFGGLYRYHSGDAKVFRPSQHYLRAGDLRSLGYQAILHVHCIHDRAGNHKLELVDTGEMSFTTMQKEILRVFDIEPSRLDLMRIDLAADVPGVPVRWFARNARAKWKQWIARLGEIEYAEMGRRKIETLYFGKRPNCFRIYDKLSELRHQYDQMQRKASDAAEIPTFEEKFKYPETGFVLTRVERQIGGGRIPQQIGKLGKLRNLSEFNPYSRLELLPGNCPEPNMDDYGVTEYLAGIGLRAKADELGVHELRSLINEHSRGNASRILRRYEAFLPRESGIDAGQLFQRYRESVGRQLAA